MLSGIGSPGSVRAEQGGDDVAEAKVQFGENSLPLHRAHEVRGSMSPKEPKTAASKQSRTSAVIEPTDTSIRGGGETCNTLILSFNGEIIKRVAELEN